MKPDDLKEEELERYIQARARTFRYPPTPDLVNKPLRWAAPARRYRRLVVGLTATVCLLIGVGFLAVPETRAEILRFFQVGGLQIFPADPQATPQSTLPLLELDFRLLDIDTPLTLAQAEDRVGFDILLPTDQRPPEAIFLHRMGGTVLIMVWFKPENPQEVEMIQYQMGPGVFAQKFDLSQIASTQVHNRPAYWLEGSHLLVFLNTRPDNLFYQQLINHHVLVWEQAGITYRLESFYSMEAAVKIAETLE
jgi:hypothetical protein